LRQLNLASVIAVVVLSLMNAGCFYGLDCALQGQCARDVYYERPDGTQQHRIECRYCKKTVPPLKVALRVAGLEAMLGESCSSPSIQKSAVASTGDVLFIAAAAHAAGAQGTNWRTDLEVHSLGDETAVFRVIILEHGADNLPSDFIEMSLPSGRSVRLGDVLFNKFSYNGSAALVLLPSAGRIIAASRTYNLLGAGNALGLPAGSTFGQSIAAEAEDRVIAKGEQGRLIQLSHSTASDRGARTNLGLVNATDHDVRIKTELFTAGGESLGTFSYTLPPFGYKQINRVFEKVTESEVDDGFAVLTTTTDNGAFFAYASVVDNLTGDPIAISAMRLPEEAPTGPARPIFVAASAHVAGAAGTNWRTDLEVHNWSDQHAGYTIELLKHGKNNSSPEMRSYALAPGRSTRFADVLETAFAFEGGAALRITTQQGRLLVTSRTYNLLRAGNPTELPAGATFGQYIPGLSEDRAIGFGEEGRLVQLTHSADDSIGSRTNLVLVNAGSTRIDVVVDLYRAGGAAVGTVNRSLAPYEYRQLNRVFASVTGSSVNDGYAVVRTTTEGGGFFALASVVDNLTGDPVGMGAPAILSEESEGALAEVDEVFGSLGQTDIEAMMDRVQGVGIDGIVDGLVANHPGPAERTPAGLSIDYGSGWTGPDDMVYAGSVEIDTSALSVSSGGINGSLTISHDNYLVDGEPPAIGPSSWTFDLTERANGTMVGTIDAGSPAGLKSSGSISGSIGIDTAICLEYPISGSITTEVQGQVVTFTFSPHCDGIVDHEILPSSTFSHSYGSPESPAAQEYVTQAWKAVVAAEEEGRYWRPIQGAETIDSTTPGVIIMHFPFDQTIIGGRLMLQVSTFHFSYSRGHAYIYGSTDGENWQQLAELEPPAAGMGHTGGLNGDLPEMFIGATDIWLRTRLYAYGPRAAEGGVWCNTAQMSRWEGLNPRNTFELEVELQ